MSPSFEQVLQSPLSLFLPSLLVLAVPPAIATSYRLLPPHLKHAAAQPFSYIHRFCTLDEIYPASPPRSRGAAPSWKVVLLVLSAAAMATRWFGTAGWDLLSGPKTSWVWDGLMGFLWAAAAVFPILSVMHTAKASLLLFYTVQVVYSVLVLLSALYQFSLLPPIPHDPVISLGDFLLQFYSIVVSSLLVGVTVTLPIEQVPQEYLGENKVEIEKGTMGASPEDRSSVYGWLTFHWLFPMIKLGSTGYLQDQDVYTLSPTQRSKPLFAAWQKLQASSLTAKIFKANGLDVFLDVTLTAVSVVLNYSSPYFIKKIIDALTNPTPESIAKAYTYALLAFLASIGKAQADLQHLWFSRRASVRIKSTLTSAIYQKSLVRIDKSGVGDSKGSAGVGKVVNLMAGDTNRIGNQASNLFMLYGAPAELIVCIAFLYSLLGWSAFVGIGVIIASMPINTAVSARSVVIQKDLLAARDKRMNIMNELIGAIKFIKMFAWERQWTKRVIDARETEMKVTIRDRWNNLIFNLLWTIIPMLVTLVSFFCFTNIQGGVLTAGTAFTALSLFSMLRMPITILPMFWVALLQTKVAIQRIEDFLKEEEVPTFVSSLKLAEQQKATNSAVDETIGFVGPASFRWNSGKADDKSSPTAPASDTAKAPADDAAPTPTEDAPFELNDLDFIFPMGLTIISGPTGSGKTALLHALLGEMEIVKGSVRLPKDANRFDEHGHSNSVAYAGQSAWLQNLSIKDNILFGSPFDKKRYEDVIKACCLAPDFKMLEDGDATEIGAKGVSLSGGQKARVALARAIYSRAKNVLLDDPLSAVDAHTAASLVNDCFAGPLLSTRRVIIISHHVELLLPVATALLRVVDGRIETQGTIEELQTRGDLASIVAHEKTAVPEDESVIVETTEEEKDPKDAAAGPKHEARKLVKDEEREVGNVAWSTYSLYFKASGLHIWALSVVLMLVSNNTSIVERYFVSLWTSNYPGGRAPPKEQFTASSFSHHHHDALYSVNGHIAHQSVFVSSFAPQNGTFVAENLPPADTHPMTYILIYTAILFGSGVITILQALIGYIGAYRASVRIHNDMLHTVVRSTSRWFDTTPTGRIVNRFSRDIEVIDSSLTQSLRVVLNYFFALIGALVVVTFITPAFFIPAVFLALAYWRLSVRYIRCGRDLRRMESTARSPIFSGFTETLEGVVTIRAFAKERSFIDNLMEQVDKSHACWYFTWMLNRWLLLRFDVLGGLAVFITSCLALAKGLNGGMGGVAILSAQSYVQAIYWTCRYWSQLEMDLNSVERAQQYLELPQEPPAIVESNRPPAYWPSSNSENLIHVEDLVVKYDPELPSVIHGISFDIKAKEKIGLIGRTGSGKSTLGMSFLRFAELAGGKIVIDGIDISTIGLEDLRSRITVIPQEAVLFSGTIRENLDPFNEHSDEECLDALERVQLGPGSSSANATPSRVASSTALSDLENADASSTAPSDSPTATVSTKKSAIRLDTEVSNGGANFSSGQRQLLAMARSLLRNSTIIIMDEATASVDFETDNRIQQTIREEFQSSCLLTIAHRLSSIVDYDRLLVLDHGSLVEFDTPFNLLQKKSGEDAIFKSMCEKSGKWDELYQTAERKAKGE